MAYSLTYAGVSFRMLPAEVERRIERFTWLQDLRDVLPLGQTWPGPNLQRTGPALPFAYPPVRIGDWFRPVGAARTSIFRGIMTADDLTGIEIGAAQTFVIESEGGDSAGSVTDSLVMLPPIPIAGSAASEPTIYLVALVDERYYWHQFASAGAITCSAATTTSTWSDLLNALAAALDITLTFAAPSSVYGQPEPDSAIYSNQESPAALLDAVAANVGCVVVRTGPGEFKLLRYADASTACNANRPASDNNLLGGLAIDQGAESNPGYAAVMPSAVMVCFPGWTADIGYIQPESYRWQYLYGSYGQTYTITVDASSLGSPYSGFDTVSGAKILHTTAKAVYDTGGSLTNGSALAALAQQLAKDYFDARTNWLNESYAGIYPWTPEGASDLLYCWHAGSVFTHILAPPFNAGLTEFQHGFGPLTPATGFSMIAESANQPGIDDGTNPVLGTSGLQWQKSTGAGSPIGMANAAVINDQFIGEAGGSGTSMGSPTAPYFQIDFADQYTTGLVTWAPQTLGGDKTFSDNVTINGGVGLTVQNNVSCTELDANTVNGETVTGTAEVVTDGYFFQQSNQGATCSLAFAIANGYNVYGGIIAP